MGRDAALPANTTGRKLNDLSQWEYATALARTVVLEEIAGMAAFVGERKAPNLFLEKLYAGELPDVIVDTVKSANARLGDSGRLLDAGTLWRWRKLAAEAQTPHDRLLALAPRGRGRRYDLRPDEAVALAIRQQPNKPSDAYCVREAIKKLNLQDVSANALAKRVSRMIKKMPVATFQFGRNTGAAYKAYQIFVRREFRTLLPNQVWVGDGHAMKMRVAHPDTGRPFVPELTVVMDAQSRYIVGWSVSLSENVLAVTDALRHAVSSHGVPLLYYSDNGSGQTAKMLDAPVIGLLTSMGIAHPTGWPGNPQGRGVIERWWQTVAIPFAKQYATYRGLGADKETLRKNSIEITRQIKAIQRADGLVTALPSKLPSFQSFIAQLTAAIDEYNNHHQHRSLPGNATPAAYRAEHMPAGGPAIPAPGELTLMFMPSVLRTPARGEVKLWNNRYFSKDLMLAPEGQVRVHFDIHDASRVWARGLSGELIAVAELNGNSADFFPKPYIQQLQDKREQGQVKRLEDKVAAVREEHDARTVYTTGAREPLPISAEEAADMARLTAEMQSANVVPLHDEQDDWAPYRRCKAIERRMAAGDAVSEADQRWCESYQKSSEYRTFEMLAEDFPQMAQSGAAG